MINGRPVNARAYLTWCGGLSGCHPSCPLRATLHAPRPVSRRPIPGPGGGANAAPHLRLPSRHRKRYNFKGGDQQKKVGDLSGGERNRLQLAKTLLQGGNVLMLDEPTNDLDVATLRCLEDAVANVRRRAALP